jgi:hypothetical protein
MILSLAPLVSKMLLHVIFVVLFQFLKKVNSLVRTGCGTTWTMWIVDFGGPVLMLFSI